MSIQITGWFFRHWLEIAVVVVSALLILLLGDKLFSACLLNFYSLFYRLGYISPPAEKDSKL